MIEYIDDQWFPNGVKIRMDPKGNQFIMLIGVTMQKNETSMTIISMSRHLIMIEYLEDQWFLTGVNMRMDTC